MLISRVHILQLSPEERALREKQIRKEMAELNYYWQDHPGELLAKYKRRILSIGNVCV
jgi:hypothetical protein